MLFTVSLKYSIKNTVEKEISYLLFLVKSCKQKITKKVYKGYSCMQGFH